MLGDPVVTGLWSLPIAFVALRDLELAWLVLVHPWKLFYFEYSEHTCLRDQSYIERDKTWFIYKNHMEEMLYMLRQFLKKSSHFLIELIFVYRIIRRKYSLVFICQMTLDSLLLFSSFVRNLFLNNLLILFIDFAPCILCWLVLLILQLCPLVSILPADWFWMGDFCKEWRNTSDQCGKGGRHSRTRYCNVIFRWESLATAFSEKFHACRKFTK